MSRICFPFFIELSDTEGFIPVLAALRDPQTRRTCIAATRKKLVRLKDPHDIQCHKALLDVLTGVIKLDPDEIEEGLRK